MFGSGDGVAGWRVHHDDAVVGCGFTIDVVYADTGSSDGFQVGCGREDVTSDFRL